MSNHLTEGIIYCHLSRGTVSCRRRSICATMVLIPRPPLKELTGIDYHILYLLELSCHGFVLISLDHVLLEQITLLQWLNKIQEISPTRSQSNNIISCRLNNIFLNGSTLIYWRILVVTVFDCFLNGGFLYLTVSFIELL